MREGGRADVGAGTEDRVIELGIGRGLVDGVVDLPELKGRVFSFEYPPPHTIRFNAVFEGRPGLGQVEVRLQRIERGVAYYE